MNSVLKDQRISVAGQAAFVSVAFLLAYGQVLWRLMEVWQRDEDYSHGFLIIPVAAYLVWSWRATLRDTAVRPWPWGWLMVAGSLFLHVTGTVAEIPTLSSLSLLTTLAGIVLYYFGFSVLRVVLFPIAFLVFMIPIPMQIYSSVTLPLQLLVSKGSVGCVGLFGIPVYRDGNIIHLPNTTLQVVQACSGLRSMISLSALSALFALTVSGIPLRTLVFLAAVPISILVNIFRVTATSVLSYRYGPEAAEGTVHQVLGISVFLLSLLLLVFWKALLGWFSARMKR